MTWLEKMDAVLDCLDKLSGQNPKMPALLEWLSTNYPKVSKGDVEDITLYLWKENMMYFDDGGLRRADYDDRNKDGKYLISCKGKMLLHDEGGFIGRKNKIIAENDRIKSNEKAVLLLTWILAVGAAGTLLYYFVDLYHKYEWFQSRFWWILCVTVVVLSVLTTYLIWRMLPPKKQEKE